MPPNHASNSAGRLSNMQASNASTTSSVAYGGIVTIHRKSFFFLLLLLFFYFLFLFLFFIAFEAMQYTIQQCAQAPGPSGWIQA